MLSYWKKFHDYGFGTMFYKALSRIEHALLRLVCAVAAAADMKFYFAQHYKAEQKIAKYYQYRIHVILPGAEILQKETTESLNKLVEMFPDLYEPKFLLAEFQLMTAQPEGHKQLLQAHHAKANYLARNKLKIEFELIPPHIVIGSLGNHWTLDSLIKANNLGLREQKPLLLCLSKTSKLRNPNLYSYFSKYIQIVDDERKIRQLNRKFKHCMIPLGLALPLDNISLFLEIGDAYVQQRYLEAGNKALLELKQEDKVRGLACLKKLGVPEGAWYVCLHVRQPGYRDNHSAAEDFRNADPQTYLDAISAVIERGGWVIRMGDPDSMTPMPTIKGLVDYAHSEYHSEWMDVFLAATCKLCIGTSSGVYNLSRLFGRPVLLTNCLPSVVIYSLTSEHSFLPRLCRRIGANEIVKFDQLFSPPISMANSSCLYQQMGMEWIENTSDELEQATIEMLDKIDGRFSYQPEEKILQELFQSKSKAWGNNFYPYAEIKLNAPIPKYFLAKHAELLQ